MYNNLLYFLVAIFLFSVDSVPTTPLLPVWQGGLVFFFLLLGYNRIARRTFLRPAAVSSAGYFGAEKRLSILALCFFAVSLYSCDPKYYLSRLPGTGLMPAVVNILGLLLFVVFLVLMWRAGRENYQQIFGRKYSVAGFVLSNLKVNLPIVLPWIILSLCYDLLALLPFPGLQKFAGSQWGDLLFFAVFLGFVVLFFPPLVRRLWGCKKLPEGHLKQRLEAFCEKQGFSADFYLWPLFEGRVLTAGVVGIVPGLRYILITPALLETLTLEELEAVMAHELGHVKKRHLLLYVFLIAGFSLLAGVVAEPMVYLLLSVEPLNRAMMHFGMGVESILTVAGAVPLLIFMIVYFRYVFGYFIRNFERQADLFTLAAVGSARPLISSFEKIAFLSGDIRDQPNWHHFGIGERIDCLERAGRQPDLVERHNRKVRYSLLGYCAVMVLSVLLFSRIPTDELAKRYQENYAETFLMQKVKQEPERALWQRLIGDLMLNRKMEKKALEAYEKAYSIEPANPEIMNNLAWLLLTSEDVSLRDPVKALTLARGAAALQPKPHILDTLATAYWAMGLVDEAVRIEMEALRADGAQKRFYQARIAKFTSESYMDEIKVPADKNGIGKKTE
jgi:Zn-dependent protease with chaperone function